jgi:hypothetical protein
MSTITTRTLRTTGALLLASALLVPAGVAQAQTLEQIIEASLEAAGGRDAMAAITSVRQTGTFTMSTAYGDLEGDTEVITIPNQKIYQLIDNDLFQQTGAWNGTTGWSDSPQGLVDVEGQQAESLAAQTVLHPFLPYNAPEFGPAEYRKLDDEELGGRPHHVVGLSTGSIEFKIYVDAETKMVSRTMFDADLPDIGTVTLTADTPAYEEHGGVMLVSATSTDIPGAFTIDTRYSTIEINVEVDHSIFEKP